MAQKTPSEEGTFKDLLEEQDQRERPTFVEGGQATLESPRIGHPGQVQRGAPRHEHLMEICTCGTTNTTKKAWCVGCGVRLVKAKGAVWISHGESSIFMQLRIKDHTQ